MKDKIAVLGSSGMLGNMALDFLSKKKKYDIVAFIRNKEYASFIKDTYPNVQVRIYDVVTDFLDLRDIQWCINAIGFIKPLINESNKKNAIILNSIFPNMLAEWAERDNCKVINIQTDCCWSGKEGNYSESSKHDALDIYGKTKSLGEIDSTNMINLRCSIIGPEKFHNLSLINWFTNQPEGAVVNGFKNHFWNGLTTLQYCKICYGIIENNTIINHLQHVVPKDFVDKCTLLNIFATSYHKNITIIPTDAPEAINRTLKTNFPETNLKLWQDAGYSSIPIVSQMIDELANYSFVERR